MQQIMCEEPDAKLLEQSSVLMQQSIPSEGEQWCEEQCNLEAEQVEYEAKPEIECWKQRFEDEVPKLHRQISEMTEQLKNSDDAKSFSEDKLQRYMGERAGFVKQIVSLKTELKSSDMAQKLQNTEAELQNIKLELQNTKVELQTTQKLLQETQKLKERAQEDLRQAESNRRQAEQERQNAKKELSRVGKQKRKSEARIAGAAQTVREHKTMAEQTKKLAEQVELQKQAIEKEKQHLETEAEKALRLAQKELRLAGVERERALREREKESRDKARIHQEKVRAEEELRLAEVERSQAVLQKNHMCCQAERGLLLAEAERGRALQEKEQAIRQAEVERQRTLQEMKKRSREKARAEEQLRQALLEKQHAEVVAHQADVVARQSLSLHKALKPDLNDRFRHCDVYKAASQVIRQLGLDHRFFDRRHDRCFCRRCYDASWPDTIDDQGPTAYVVPRGWVRIGLETPVIFDAKDVWNTWSVSFHGAKVKVIKSIVESGGFIAMPGDELPDGTKLRSDHCAGRQDRCIYTSPTVRYAGLKFYAAPCRLEGTELSFQVAFQCRQQPNSFTKQRETMGFARSGRQHELCPLVKREEMEWKTTRRQTVMPYGLVVRTYPMSRPPACFSSPVDTD